jgi:hypothetical protein
MHKNVAKNTDSRCKHYYIVSVRKLVLFDTHFAEAATRMKVQVVLLMSMLLPQVVSIRILYRRLRSLHYAFRFREVNQCGK